MEEIFKDIKGYEGLYQISNFGNVKSLERKIKNRLGSFNLKKEKILKNKTVNNYKYISLRKNNKPKNFYIHRLVSINFIDNIFNKKEVNHIDGDKSNNNISNLEWVTPKENSQHSYNIGLSKKGDNHYTRIKKNGIKASN